MWLKKVYTKEHDYLIAPYVYSISRYLFSPHKDLLSCDILVILTETCSRLKLPVLSLQNDLIHAWGLDMKLGYCAQANS